MLSKISKEKNTQSINIGFEKIPPKNETVSSRIKRFGIAPSLSSRESRSDCNKIAAKTQQYPRKKM